MRSEVRAGQHDEQRRRVDAAVVAAERHLAERGHLAVAHLVQDLAGLGVALGVDLGRLRRGQKREHAARELGSIHSISSAVMMPSRPNGVLNQGTPA